MKEHSGVFPIQKMAKALKLSLSRYYALLNFSVTDHEKRDQKRVRSLNGSTRKT